MSNRPLHRLSVRRKPGDPRRGWLIVGGRAIPVALGRGGIRANKREGDGGTPRGRFRLVRLWWRADRHPRPQTGLPVRRIGPRDGWCEDPSDRRYNRRVDVPQNSKADRLARQDALYDYIIEIDHNTRPRIAGRGCLRMSVRGRLSSSNKAFSGETGAGSREKRPTGFRRLRAFTSG